MRARTRNKASLPSSDLPRAAERPRSSATCLRACRRPKTGPEVGSGKATASSSPRRRRRKASMRRRGQEVMLAMVRFLTLPFSRKDSRRRTAGGEVRLGISATYMCSEYRKSLVKSIYITHITCLHFHPQSTPLRLRLTIYSKKTCEDPPKIRGPRRCPEWFRV